MGLEEIGSFGALGTTVGAGEGAVRGVVVVSIAVSAAGIAVGSGTVSSAVVVMVVVASAGEELTSVVACFVAICGNLLAAGEAFPPPAFAAVFPVVGAGDFAGLFTATLGKEVVAVFGPMDVAFQENSSFKSVKCDDEAIKQKATTTSTSYFWRKTVGTCTHAGLLLAGWLPPQHKLRRLVSQNKENTKKIIVLF